MTVYKEVPVSVQTFMNEIKDLCGEKNQRWADIFENTFSNTLLTTVKRISENDTYVLTGDIPAMWLRDSTAQVRPYLVMASKDKEIAGMIKGLVHRQFKMINIDPYANAFNEFENGAGHQDDHTDLLPIIWERKYEIDSLCYPVQLAYLYYKQTGDESVFDQTFLDGVEKILNLWIVEQDHSNSPYTFERDTTRSEDTLSNDGRGPKHAYTGMTWSGFRPSDDACIYSYLVPSNMFAVVVLDYLLEVLPNHFKRQDLVDKARQLRNEIDAGIKEHGIVETEDGTKIYAYEVDGLGNALTIDDPNVPSLLAAPYLGYCDFDDEVYVNTRNHILSKSNKYYYEGKYSQGCGSSHTHPNFIWPIALSIEGLTTHDKAHKESLLNNLASNDGGTLMMHESFDVNDPTQFSREWFSWANMMFCELVMDYFDIRVER